MADVTFGDSEIWNAFVRGDACMHMNTVVFYTSEPTAETTHMALAKKLDKPLEEVVGWAPPPIGRNGYGAAGLPRARSTRCRSAPTSATTRCRPSSTCTRS